LNFIGEILQKKNNWMNCPWRQDDDDLPTQKVLDLCKGRVTIHYFFLKVKQKW